MVCIEPNGENLENDFYDIKTITPSNARFFLNIYELNPALPVILSARKSRTAFFPA